MPATRQSWQLESSRRSRSVRQAPVGTALADAVGVTLAAVGRSRYLAILAGVLLAGLCLPSASLAGAYSWDLPANFTTSPPGANPDHDSYGAAPWSYVDAATPLLGAPTYQSLTAFASPTRGGLAGWTDPSSTDVLVGANPTGGSVTNGADVFPPGKLVMSPGALGREVAVAWTSPLPHSALVTVTGSITAADPGACVSTFTWSLSDQTGTVLRSGNATNGVISFTPSVAAGGTLYLTVHPGLVHSLDCDTALVTLHIDATETSAPSVSLDTPANGSTITGQPSFSGSASTAFGASPTVTVRIYKGPGVAGAPVQTVTATRSNLGRYTVAAAASLADGQYTAQAEQDDLSNPPDVGLSAPSTFTIHNAGPTVTLNALGNQPLTTATPTLSGQGTANGIVALAIYPGGSPSGTPVQTGTGTTDTSGKFSVKVSSGLANGQYTAVAAQTVSGVLGLSNSVTFTIKVPTTTGAHASIGSAIALSRSGVASVPITCLGSSGQFCAGNILVLTTRSLRPLAGGPVGPVRVMFAYVNIPGGRTQMVSRPMRPDVARALRRLKSVRIRVSANLTGTPSSTIVRTLQFSR
jgi:hypothetical protein